MLATCHTILEEVLLPEEMVPLLWALVRLMPFSPSRIGPGSSGNIRVLRARCSCVRHAEQVARRPRQWVDEMVAPGDSGTDPGGAVTAPHLNFKVPGPLDSHTQKIRMKIHFFSL